MVFDTPGPFSSEVPISVVAEIDDRWTVGLGAIVDPEPVVVVEQIAHCGRQRPRIAFITVRADAGETHAGGALLADLLGVPDALVEPAYPAVEVVRAIVRRELIGLTVEGEAAIGDTVSVAAGDAAEVRVVVIQIAGEISEPERHVRELTVPVRGPDGADDAA